MNRFAKSQIEERSLVEKKHGSTKIQISTWFTALLLFSSYRCGQGRYPPALLLPYTIKRRKILYLGMATSVIFPEETALFYRGGHKFKISIMTLADYSLIAHTIQLSGAWIKTYLFKTNQYLKPYNEY